MSGQTAPEIYPEIWSSIDGATVNPAIFKRISLGSGPKGHNPPGVICIDSNPKAEPDILHDLRSYPWPFEDSSVHEVFASHFLEHVPGPEQPRLWNELQRICADKAFIRVAGPHHRHVDGYRDPTHVFFMSREFFHYLSVPGRLLLNIPFYDDTWHMDFELASYQEALEPKLEWLSDEARSFWAEHYWNVIKEIRATLICHKPIRTREEVVAK